MNTDKLLDIINCTLTDENIYELFKNHGYDESFGNLQKDLANLLDKFIVTDGELNEVAGGRASVLTRVSSGILASIASFSGMNFVGARTLKEEQSKSQRVLNNIKEIGVNSTKEAAKFVINNGGKIAGGGALLVTWSLLCALIGRHTKEVPVVETKDMTEDEKKLIEFARRVLDKIYKDINSGSKRYFNSDQKSYDSLQELITESEKIDGIQKISSDVNVGQLVEKLLPERQETSTQAYRDGRAELIKYEKELIDLAKTLIKRHSTDNVETLEKELQRLKEESKEQKEKLQEVSREKEQLQEQIKTDEDTHKKEIDVIEQEKQELTNQLNQVSEEKQKMENELEDLKKENTKKEEDSKKKDSEINANAEKIQELQNEQERLQKEIEKVKKESNLKEQKITSEAKKEKDLLQNEYCKLKTELDQLKQTHENHVNYTKALANKMNKEGSKVSLDTWNTLLEPYLHNFTNSEKIKALTEWTKNAETSVSESVLNAISDFFFGGKHPPFNVPKEIPDSYKNSVLGSQAVTWKYVIYHKPADSLDRDQLRKNFVDKTLWLGLFADLEKPGGEKHVDLVFVLFQACRLAGWTFVPETICKALLEHYKNCETNKIKCNDELKKRIEQLLDLCGLRLRSNGIYPTKGANCNKTAFSYHSD